MSQDRTLPPSPQPFVAAGDVAPQRVSKIEGAAEAGEIWVKPMIAGSEMMLMEVHRKKGLKDPKHVHPDHESICYLVSGKMRVVIGDREFIAEPGATWVHPAGVEHYHETLEDSVQLEIKSPPRKTWG